MAANSITVKVLNIITDAMIEVGALAGGETPSLDDSAWILRKLQRLIDRYNARKPMVYNVNFSRFTIPINKQPITIGPDGADFNVNQRPVDIESISLILTSTGDSEIELPLNKRDQDWWAANTIKNLTSTLPTDFYYSPDWDNGQIYLWPIPTAVNDVRIQSRLVLAELTTYAQNFSMPPAYWDLIVSELAISLCPGFERSASPELIQMQKAALKAVQTLNISSPRLASDAPSQPGNSNARPDFNFLDGLSR